MQMRDPKQVIHTWLLDSVHLGDQVVPHSIDILREQQVGQLRYFIVTYTTQLQMQCYACMQVAQTEPGFWSFSGFQMMGGYSVADFAQNMPPQIAWARSCWSDDSSCALVVFPNTGEGTSICLRDGLRVVCDESLENSTILFFTNQQLRERLHVELYDRGQILVAQYLI